MWATAVDDTRKMTDFMTHPLRVSAPSAGYAALARHLHHQRNRVGKMLKKHEAGRTISLEAVQACALISVIKTN